MDCAGDNVARLLVPGLNVVGATERCSRQQSASCRLTVEIKGYQIHLKDSKTGATVSSSRVDENPLMTECTVVQTSPEVTCRMGSCENELEALIRGLKNQTINFVLQNDISEVGWMLAEDAQGIDKGTWENPVSLTPVYRAKPTGALVAPTLDINAKSEVVSWTSFFIDVLCFVPKTCSGGRLVNEYVVQALLRISEEMLQLSKEGGHDPGKHYFRSFYFWPESFLTFPVVVAYPLMSQGVDDEAGLADTRRAMHTMLGLPKTRPVFKTANAIQLNDTKTSIQSSEKQARLKNVDRGLPKAQVAGGSVHRIQGDYEYYHYKQDKFDDSGWGCAYRSLQTICSWFKLQGYTGRDPPMHREIQTTLFSIGDKPKEFIGSRNWIGAIELGFVLETLYNIQSKVITVSDGSNMASVAQDIGHHFDTQGTPIMIGGGVLAYTLLGIDYNESTGDCAFLILDPHYTGSDDLSKIQQGKWVSWKKVGEKAAAGGDLFVTGAFYNLLCPQCPSDV